MGTAAESGGEAIVGTLPDALNAMRHSDQVLAGGGAMGSLMRSIDWAATPLGAVETWPQSLRMMVRFLLANRFPLLLWWGPEYIQLYNNAYRPVLGTKHPRSMGQPANECFPEIWDIIGPLIDTPFRGGPATWKEDLAVEVKRHGFVEETHFTVAYSPVPDESAPRGIGGVLATVHETTEKVIGERRVGLLGELGARSLAEAATAESACIVAAQTLSRHPDDVPFALLYLIETDSTTGRRQARLAGAAGVAPGEPISPRVIELPHLSASSASGHRLAAEDRQQETDHAIASHPWPFAEALETDAGRIVENLVARFGQVPPGPWSDPPHAAVVLPIRSNTAHWAAGLLVAGVSSRLALDERYLSFLELLSAQVATAIANARGLEAERRRAEALAELDRAKTAFFSNVSHEFRTPLTLMLGPLEEALRAPPEVLAGRHDDLALVHRNGLRLLRLVNTLLDFSRIEAGRVHASYEPVDLASFTAELASVFRAATDKAGLTLTLDCPPLTEPAWVDRDMWEKIVLNLVSNAFKFTLEGGITVRQRQEGAQVHLEVEDTGTGVPASELPRLFDRFHRVEGARGRTHEGTGIGLALVQELAKLHGGTVHAQSTPGRGSTFTVSIPLGSAHLPADRLRADRRADNTAIHAQPYVEEALRWLPDQIDGQVLDDIDSPSLSQPAAVTAIGRERPTVVLADDNADMRAYVARLLDPRYDVRMVADGVAALAAVRERRPDLVLSDVMMPRLDGFGLVREIRSDPALASLPIILVSARAGEEASIEGFEAGADDYLIKPFSARELLARVASALQTAMLRREFEQRVTADLAAMTRLHEIGNQCVRAGHNVDERLRDILDAALAITAADKGTFQLLDDASNTLRIVAQTGFDEPFLAFFARVEPGESSACSAAMQTSARVTVDNVTKSDFFAGRAALDMMLAAGVASVQSTPLVGSDGATFGVISTHFRTPHRPSERELRLMDLLARQTVDYLERRHAEDAFRSSQTQLEAIFNDSPLGVYLVDNTFHIRRVNPTAAAVFGDIPDLIGRDFADVMHLLWRQEHADEIVHRFRHTLDTGESYVAPEQIEERRDRGIVEYYEWQVHRVPLPGGHYGAVCYFRDIAPQVRARETVRSALVTAETANRVKSDFLTAMSHELRTPLNAIAGHVQLLQMGVHGPLAPAQHDALVRVAMNQQHLLSVITDILNFAKLEAGRVEYDLQECRTRRGGGRRRRDDGIAGDRERTRVRIARRARRRRASRSGQAAANSRQHPEQRPQVHTERRPHCGGPPVTRRRA